MKSGLISARCLAECIGVLQSGDNSAQPSITLQGFKSPIRFSDDSRVHVSYRSLVAGMSFGSPITNFDKRFDYVTTNRDVLCAALRVEEEDLWDAILETVDHRDFYVSLHLVPLLCALEESIRPHHAKEIRKIMQGSDIWCIVISQLAIALSLMSGSLTTLPSSFLSYMDNCVSLLDHTGKALSDKISRAIVQDVKSMATSHAHPPMLIPRRAASKTPPPMVVLATLPRRRSVVTPPPLLAEPEVCQPALAEESEGEAALAEIDDEFRQRLMHNEEDLRDRREKYGRSLAEKRAAYSISLREQMSRHEKCLVEIREKHELELRAIREANDEQLALLHARSEAPQRRLCSVARDVAAARRGSTSVVVS